MTLDGGIALAIIVVAIVFLIGIAEIRDAASDNATLKGSNTQLKAALAAEKQARAEDVARLDAVIADYKKRVAAAEDEIAKCEDPATRAQKLRELFS